MKKIYIYDVKSGKLMGTYQSETVKVVDMINVLTIEGVARCVIV
jgi:hypothetical protein